MSASGDSGSGSYKTKENSIEKLIHDKNIFHKEKLINEAEYILGRAGDYIIGSGEYLPLPPTQPPRQLVQPATQADLEALTGQYEGRIENWRERFPEERIEHYRDGASGGVFKAWDTKTGRVVGLKELKGSKKGVDLEFLQTGEEQIRNIGDMISALGKSQHPGLMRIYGYYETERRGLRYPQLVFELIDQPSMLDIINGGASEEDVRKFLISGGSTLHHLHTSNGQPIFHRDVKPANFMAMPADGRWPYVLVDFGTVGIGVRETLKGGTHAGTVKYVPHKQLAFGKMNKWGENFALIRSAIHYALGSRFDEIDLDDFDIRSLELNYSEKLLNVFATATIQDESKGYGDFQKLMHDLGYGNSRVPQTRGELEAILGHKSLPVRVESKKQEIDENGDLNLSVVYDNHGIVVIDGKSFDTQDLTVYQALSEIKMGRAFDPETGEDDYILDKKGNKRILAYLQYVVAPKYPAIQDALSGKRSLEDAVKEKGPSLPRKAFDFLFSTLPAKVLDILESAPEDGIYGNSARGDHKQLQKDYLARRKQLYEICGVDILNFSYSTDGQVNPGAGIGGLGGFGIGTFLPLILGTGNDNLLSLSLILGSIDFGTVLGKNIREHYAQKKLKKQAREIDSWIEEARRAQNPSPLEIKVEDIELTEEEKKKYNDLTTGIGALACGVLGAASYGLFHHLGLHTPEVLAWTTGLGVGVPWTIATKNLLINRKLREKRIAAGLDEDGRETYTFIVSDSRILPSKIPNLEDIFFRNGLYKKGIFSKRFAGKDIDVRYEERDDPVYRKDKKVVIKATPESKSKAQDLYNDIWINYEVRDNSGRLIDFYDPGEIPRDPLQPLPAGTILSDGTKIPDVKKIGRVGGSTVNL